MRGHMHCCTLLSLQGVVKYGILRLPTLYCMPLGHRRRAAVTVSSSSQRNIRILCLLGQNMRIFASYANMARNYQICENMRRHIWAQPTAVYCMYGQGNCMSGSDIFFFVHYASIIFVDYFSNFAVYTPKCFSISIICCNTEKVHNAFCMIGMGPPVVKDEKL